MLREFLEYFFAVLRLILKDFFNTTKDRQLTLK